jgi:hypothetical protein
VIADPVDVLIGVTPSKNNLATIDELIKVAGGIP